MTDCTVGKEQIALREPDCGGVLILSAGMLVGIINCRIVGTQPVYELVHQRNGTVIVSIKIEGTVIVLAPCLMSEVFKQTVGYSHCKSAGIGVVDRAVAVGVFIDVLGHLNELIQRPLVVQYEIVGGFHIVLLDHIAVEEHRTGCIKTVI